MKISSFLLSIVVFSVASAYACPSPGRLMGVMVGNAQMEHKGVTFEDGTIWKINYISSFYDLNSVHWGILGDFHKMDIMQLPRIELEGSTDWTPMSWFDELGRHVRYRKACHYKVSKPVLWAPSPDGAEVYWRFSLSTDRDSSHDLSVSVDSTEE